MRVDSRAVIAILLRLAYAMTAASLACLEYRSWYRETYNATSDKAPRATSAQCPGYGELSPQGIGVPKALAKHLALIETYRAFEPLTRPCRPLRAFKVTGLAPAC